MLSRSAASGAIFNHVLLWQPAPPADDGDVVRPSAFLRGHEGAIHRLAWHDGGTLLCSVSEDRSARLWDTRGAWSACETPHELQPASSLFGHTGRVWDAAFLDGGMLATVAEDSTARLWRLDGTPLAAIQGHRGRGIWRCAAAGGALATGGADGGIKLWRLADWLPHDLAAEHTSAGGTDTLVFAEPLDVVAADAPRARGKECVPIDAAAASANELSRCSYCRCVAVVSSTLLLYATNAGAVRTVDVSSPQAPRWSPELFASDGAAVLCLRVAPPQACPAGVAARVLIGDMAGFATVLDVLAGSDGYEGRVLARWLAHDRGRTLAVFWLHTAAGHLPATADALGALKVWRLEEGGEARELAHAQLKFRVSSAAAQPQADARSTTTILCGDQNGNVFAFGLPSDGGELAALGSVAHAHAAAIVTFAGCTAHDAVTAGGDGYVCSFAVLPSGVLARTRRLHVAAITAIEALQDDDLAVAGSTCIAAGVTSSDAVVMDVRNACELLRVPCGGWRKPHAFLLGPAGRFIVASVRDGSVHLHRRWPEGAVGSGGPDAHRSLRASHHGREIHAAVLVPAPGHARCALITGAEDGTLFRLYFDANAAPPLDGAALMAQTAGGTAVRSLSLLRDADGRCLLVSAGAKEVLMCWALAWTAAGELTAQLLAAHSRPDDAFHRAWRSSADMPAEATGGDQRYMSVCAFVIAGELFAVASSSDGTLLMWAMSLSTAARWRFVAVLHSGSCPVLALDCVVTADGGVWLFSGATDGTVAVWDASAAVRHAMAAPEEAPGVLPELSPSLVLQHAHQSGVNSLRVARQPAAAADAWVLVSGGDDQAVNAVALELTPACRVIAACRRPGAHASGVKGVWTDGAAVHTVSLDQRVRSWRLGAAAGPVACADLDAPWLARLGDAEHTVGCRVDMQRWWASGDAQSISLDLAGSSVTEVPDVETLAALPLASGCVIAVAGRGVQLFA